MQRIVFKTIGKLRARPEPYDFSKTTWTKIEQSARMRLNKFSRPVEDVFRQAASEPAEKRP